MTQEKIEKRISGFRFWKNANFCLLFVCFVASILVKHEELKVIFRYHQLFFFGLYLTCAWFKELYEDLKEK